MSKLHQSGAFQTLDGTPRQLGLHGVLQLQARHAGWLQVSGGAVWITRSGDPADHVLDAGSRLFLGAGERVLAEPWRAQEAVCIAWAVGAAPPVAVPGLAGVVGAVRRPAALARAGAAWRAAAHGVHRAAARLAARLAAVARRAHARA